MGERLNLQRCQSIITRPRGCRLCRRERESCRVLEREGEKEKKVRTATVAAIQIENYIIVEINHDPLIMVSVSTCACRFKQLCFSLLLPLSLWEPILFSLTHPHEPQVPFVSKRHNSHILISAATAGTRGLGFGLGLGSGSVETNSFERGRCMLGLTGTMLGWKLERGWEYLRRVGPEGIKLVRMGRTQFLGY
jgi:hypothetical protein